MSTPSQSPDSNPEKEQEVFDFEAEKLSSLHRELTDIGIKTEAQALVLASNDGVLAQYGDPDLQLNTHCNVKGITGILAGILIDRGLMDLDEPVSTYVTERLGLESDFPEPTIRNLLSHSSGFLPAWLLVQEQGLRGEAAEQAAQELAFDVHDDGNDFLLTLVPRSEPGKEHSYSNEGVQLLGIAISRAAGMSYEDFARKEVLEPLMMTSTEFATDKAGNANAAFHLQSTANDLLKLGLLLMNEGLHKDTQIVSSEWVKKMTSCSGIDEHWGLLWRSRSLEVEGIAASFGMNDNLILSIADSGLVLVRTGLNRTIAASWLFEREEKGFLERLVRGEVA